MDSIKVYVEVDNMTYEFPSEESLEAWALRGEETYTSVRVATLEEQKIAGLASFVA